MFSYLHFVFLLLKESLETAQKEAQLCSGDGELPPERSADEQTLQSPSQHTAQLVEEHSPAAYIDPTPQPDIGTDRTVPKVGNVPNCLKWQAASSERACSGSVAFLPDPTFWPKNLYRYMILRIIFFQMGIFLVNYIPKVSR
jgi:hypothetical protein